MQNIEECKIVEKGRPRKNNIEKLASEKLQKEKLININQR